MTPEGKKEIRQAISDAVREAVALAYEDAAKIAEKVGGHDLGDSYITPRIAAAIRARIK
jgi:hypothetical protein